MKLKKPRKPKSFIHEVTITASKFENYHQFDQHVAQAKMWLQWREKRKNYTLGPACYDRQTFKFRSGSTATMFGLKWL